MIVDVILNLMVGNMYIFEMNFIVELVNDLVGFYYSMFDWNGIIM